MNNSYDDHSGSNPRGQGNFRSNKKSYGFSQTQNNSYQNNNNYRNSYNQGNRNQSFSNYQVSDISDKNRDSFPFAEHVSDVAIVTQLRSNVTRLVLNSNNGPRKIPGPQPHTLSRASLEYLKSDPYWVCEKSDGQRTLFYACASGIYLVDRSYNFFRLTLLPEIYEKVFNASTQGDTLIDGEIIINEAIKPKVDEYNANGIYTLCMFDIIYAFGKKVSNERLYYRLQYLKTVKRAFMDVVKRSELDSSISLPLYLETKQFVAGHDIEQITKYIRYDDELEEWIYENPLKCMKVKNDGLILTPDDNDYLMSNHKSNTHVIYKLKWIGLQTVDFLITKDGFFKTPTMPLYPETVDLYIKSRVLGRGKGDAMDVLFVNTKISRTECEKIHKWFQSLNFANSIVAECVYNPIQGCWNFKHHRKDKDSPNFITTAISSLEAMTENLTVEQVAEVLQNANRTRGITE